MSSATTTKPKASITNGAPLAEACVPGGAQSVHSRGIANEPRSESRRLSVSTPETRLIFSTSNRRPRRG